MDNNIIKVSGILDEEFKYSHNVGDEEFYSCALRVPRLSDNVDHIPIVVPSRLIRDKRYKSGDFLCFSGQLRSYNKPAQNGTRLVLTVFAREVETPPPDGEYANEITLGGFVCKAPIYRKTPMGREITDIILAVNRAYNRSDYIPCIAWGKNAQECALFSVGDGITLRGRLQSREYQKRISDTESVTKTAYEVSITNLEKIS